MKKLNTFINMLKNQNINSMNKNDLLAPQDLYFPVISS